MRRLALILALLLIVSNGSVRGGMFDELSDAMLFNSFSSVNTVDDFAFVTNPIGVATLYLDSTIGMFVEASFLPLDDEPISSKLCGDILLVRSFSNVVSVIDVSHPPTLALLSRVDLGYDFYDISCRAGRLFVAAGFQGTRQYLIGSGSSPQLVDSSLTGVHCIQVEVYGDDLLVLDDYNGLLRYDVSDGFLGQPDEQLLVPRQVATFCRLNDRLAMPLVSKSLVYWGDAQPGAMALTDSISVTILASEAYLADTLLALVDGEDRIMEVRSTQSSARTLVTLPDDTPEFFDGAVYSVDHSWQLLYPTSDFGLSRLNLSEIWFDDEPAQAYDYPGPVTTLGSHDDLLLTGGVANPLEVYSLDSASRALLQTDYGGLDHIGPLCDAGSYVFAYLTGLKRIAELRVTADSVSLVTQFLPSRIPRRMRYYDYPQVDSLGIFVFSSGKTVDLYGVTSDGRLKRGTQPTAETLGNILDFAIVDTFLVVTTEDRQLYWFRLWGGMSATLWGSVSTTGAFDHITPTGLRTSFDGYDMASMVLAFEGNKMYQVSIQYAGPAFISYLTMLPVPVTGSARGPSDLFTIGPLGAGRIDLRYSTPQMVEHGGYAGNMIAYADSTVGVSDSSGVFLYRLAPATTTAVPDSPPGALVPHDYGLVNYPNPFNPSTLISFTLERASEVELSITNILGQRVATLIEGRLDAGLHTVTWTGSDSRGRQVASGVYLYRLSTPEGSATRKMILLR